MKKFALNKNIIKFLSAQTISLFGSSIVQYAIIWHITLTTSSGLMLSISTLCGFLPQILIALFAGSWIDTHDRKKIIIYADTTIAISTLLLLLAMLAGLNSIILLFIVLAIRSAGSGIQTPAVNAFIPQLVKQSDLMRVNGINATLASMMMFLSPAISGAILSFASLELTLCIDIITAIIGVLITLTIKAKTHIKIVANKKSNIANMQAGFKYVLDFKKLFYLLLYQIVILVLISPSAFLTPLLVNRTFGIEVWRLSMSEMTYALGMIVGGILISTWGGFNNRLKTTIVAGAVYGLIMIGLGSANIFIIYLIFNALIGITSPCYNTPITTYIQERVDPQMHGRIFSLMQIATSCALPLGMLLFGPLGDIFSIQSILIVNGVLVLLFSCYKLFGVNKERV